MAGTDRKQDNESVSGMQNPFCKWFFMPFFIPAKAMVAASHQMPKIAGWERE